MQTEEFTATQIVVLIEPVARTSHRVSSVGSARIAERRASREFIFASFHGNRPNRASAAMVTKRAVPVTALEGGRFSHHLTILHLGSVFWSSFSPTSVIFVSLTKRVVRLLRTLSSFNPASVTCVP